MFFKKSVKNMDSEGNGLAQILTSQGNDALPNSEFFRDKTMDMSIDSLKDVASYLDTLADIELSDQDKMRVIYRAGGYLGEVIKQESKRDLHWYKCKNVPAVDKFCNNVGSVLVLSDDRNSNAMLPFAKIAQIVIHKEKEDLVFYAKAFLALEEQK